MKAYVIKRDDGKYLAIGGSSGYEHFWTEDLRYAYTSWLDKSYANDYVSNKYPNCKVVPITIIEGDLEEHDKQKDQKIAELKAHIKDMEQEQIAEINEHEEFAKNAKYKIAELEKALELAVKDKCELENMFYSNALGLEGAKLAVPKKEQWYLEEAQKELNNDR